METRDAFTNSNSGTKNSPPAGDFRQLLQSELTRRTRENPTYSLRAFAKSLGIDHSLLSKILRNERGLSSSLVEKIGQKLNLPLEQIEYYQSSLRVAKLNSTPANVDRYMPLSQEIFEIISDWRHYAILELMKVEGFEPYH